MLFGLITWLQLLLVGRSLRADGRLALAETLLPAGKIYVEYQPPPIHRRDTFWLVVRNALGIVGRARLLPHASGVGRTAILLARPGFYLLSVHFPRSPARPWAKSRLYIAAPPYTTVAALRAYHNALLAQRQPAPPSEPELEVELAPFPEADTLSIPLPEENELGPPLSEIELSSFGADTLTWETGLEEELEYTD
ncbi:MAG: hypothetical protein NZ958_03690 [Bacteroidia bacterium]|nr:hypothetical protein [Bacteroidia bacterium]MDW8088321.1 hypothetical protein [Bacteroidia bacterium]